ncbi:C25 family cysteine peptidase [Candidatus Marinimicrobia bacterium]|nr:C25 family cysteine peptidase [Candidatus Neomarinimicrobiota bacterium]
MKNILCLFLFFGLLIPGKPLSFKSFDSNNLNQLYGRGDFLIVLASSSLENYLSNDALGGDFVKFKNSQGYNVKVISYDTQGFESNEDLRNYLISYNEETNGMLEYVLLVGDVNGNYAIPTFTINSYNEQEIDVTDYTYTYSDDPYEPLFFIGRWSVRTVLDFFNIKSRSIQYVTNQNLQTLDDDLSHFDRALLVAGNYKTAEGQEVPPNEWPVTPVWTSHWLFEELQNYKDFNNDGYATIDTAYFHQYNYQTATYNPNIQDSWNNGVGVINYRGWGDANGWHKPYLHREEVLSLSNGWKMPVVMSFVCNTGDFGNDYIVPGLDKCFGEALTTGGSLQAPMGAAAMVGPSDLDTDTRFNNVICGVMWDSMLAGDTPELAPALHMGKQALVNEFSGLSVGNTVIDLFYHHVYSVIGDPSLPVFLEKPQNLSTDLDLDENNIMDDDLESSFIVTYIYDDNGNAIPDVVAALFKDGQPFYTDNTESQIYKGISNDEGLLIIDFNLIDSSNLTLYLNKPQFLQKSIAINYTSDNGLELTQNQSIDLDVSIEGDLFAVASENYNFDISVFNPSQFDIGEFTIELIFSRYDDSNEISFQLPVISSLNSGDKLNFIDNSVTILSNYNIGDKLKVRPVVSTNLFNISTEISELIVSSNNSYYPDDSPSPSCDYGYKSYDNFDNHEYAPTYNWIELNDLDNAVNLNLQDDTQTTVNLPIDFKYFGENYSEGSPLTICSNGWISFEPTEVSYFWNFSIPNPMGPSAMIAPFMDDLDDNGGAEPFNVWYFYDEANSRIIIEWDNVSNGEDDQNCPNCIKESFQVILTSNDDHDADILFQYKEIWDIDENGNFSTIGIESPNQDDGIEYLFSGNRGFGANFPSNSNTLVDNLAILFKIEEASCVLMDINLDGIINVVDIVAVVNHILGSTVLNESQLCSADTNSDSIINVVDIVAIVNNILGS